MNETVMVLWTFMFDAEGNLHRSVDAPALTFDQCWKFMQMDEEVPEGESTGHDIMLCRLRELEKAHPDKTPEEMRDRFRKALQELFLLFRKGALSTKQFIGTSADRLEDIKKNGIAHDEGMWLTEETPWNADGCHPWSGCDDEPVRGLILEVDLSQLSDNCIFPQDNGSLTYAGTIPWSAVTRYTVIDWEKIDDGWEHFATHRMPGSLENAPFTRWVMGYPVTVEEMVWPLQRGYKAEDTSPESNQAWSRYEWDEHPDLPQTGFDDPDYESTVDACPVEDRQGYVEDCAERLTKRNGITVTVIRETPWSRLSLLSIHRTFDTYAELAAFFREKAWKKEDEAA
jgi:hypothetical protein